MGGGLCNLHGRDRLCRALIGNSGWIRARPVGFTRCPTRGTTIPELSSCSPARFARKPSSVAVPDRCDWGGIPGRPWARQWGDDAVVVGCAGPWAGHRHLRRLRPKPGEIRTRHLEVDDLVGDRTLPWLSIWRIWRVGVGVDTCLQGGCTPGARIGRRGPGDRGAPGKKGSGHDRRKPGGTQLAGP